jgi:hypothetical protein
MIMTPTRARRRSKIVFIVLEKAWVIGKFLCGFIE